MICSFRDSEAEKLFNNRFSKRYQTIERAARRKLLILDGAEKLGDLTVLPGTHLELLTKECKGQYSIRINAQYRICFNWRERDAFDVEIVDYH